jgi:hypothetical protein
LERDPGDRYQSALEFAHDLEHQDQVGMVERGEQKLFPKKVLFYGALAAIPATIFAMLLYVARAA